MRGAARSRVRSGLRSNSCGGSRAGWTDALRLGNSGSDDADWGPGFVETKGGFQSGIALARRLRTMCADLKILAITQQETSTAIDWFDKQANGLFRKADALSNPESLVRHVARLLGDDSVAPLRVFIVHGHEIALRDELKHILETEFYLDVVVLDQRAWRGRSVLEKLEDELATVDIAFVLLTPDDLAIDQRNRLEERARPNVLFELGYLLVGCLAAAVE